MNVREYIKSASFKGIVVGICLAIILLIILQVGIAIGERRARFANHFGESFERNFRSPQDGGFMHRKLPGGSDMPGGHGAVGKIVSVALPQIIVAGPDNLEKTVIVSSSTEIREFRNTVQSNELKVGDFIVALGVPNDKGEVEAKLIRLLPPPPDMELKSKSSR